MAFPPSPFGFSPVDIGEALRNLTKASRVIYRGTAPTAINNVGGPMGPIVPRLPASQRAGASPVGGVGGIGAALGGILGGASSRLIPRGGMQGPQQQSDPLMDLYNQLVEQLQAPVAGPKAVDTEDLMRQIKAAINPIYDQRANSAKGQSDRGRQEVEEMYRALSNDYERLAPEQVKQAAGAQEEIKQLYGQLRSNVEGSYSRVSEEQADLFKDLGIEQALPEVMAEQQAPVQEALTAASENQAQQEQRYLDIGQMDATYMREGSPLATMAGNEIQTDMLTQLQDYLSQIEAERTSGIQGSYTDQLGQANSQLAQQQQVAQQEAARRQEMLFSMLQSQMQGKQQQALTPDTFMGQLPPQQQQAVAGAYTRLQRSPEAVYGKVQDPRNPTPGTFVETTPQWYMAQADEMLKRGEIDPVTHQALLMYMQLSLGK